MHSELTQKKNQEVLLAANRAGPARGIKKSNLDYYGSTPPVLPRKPKGKTLIQQNSPPSLANGSTLEMTGKNMVTKTSPQD